jgi:hypothetical protein
MGAWPRLELIAERGARPKESKNNPWLLQNYVTYDTLAETYILLRLL